MEKADFTIIKGEQQDTGDEYVRWEFTEPGSKVTSMFVVNKTAIIENVLRRIEENARMRDDIDITYDSFEEKKNHDNKIDELEEMFQDDEKVVVFDYRDHRK